MKLSIEANTVALDGNACSAHQVEEIIQQLGLIRAQMEPPVTETLPQDGLINIQHYPQMEVRMDIDGNIVLALRDFGLGWIVFSMPAGQAAFLRDALVKRTAGIAVSAIEEQTGNRH